ncbi:GAF domain-containing sensor histidine kinase [Cecembia calidifontis]|uniref:histidine kinase n=1 Tax=Cecembia calidifontis TaxID=1187080 RepID=A0A4Q7PBU2_9BACT|nr:GAF domain-containing sensor histidine kinase [Cecembia calidifontis]RZS97040.1 GAF sensor signal transduction histidine kinase [Cecembia calidifontis]
MKVFDTFAKSNDMNTDLNKTELQRVNSIYEYVLDFTELTPEFENLSRLLSFITGARFSFINILDHQIQWPLATFGMYPGPMDVDESICVYTIQQDQDFIVEDLTKDYRFKDRSYVKKDPKLKYYYGVPLKNLQGFNVGTVCVMDTYKLNLNDDQIKGIRFIADEIINKLDLLKEIKTKNQEIVDLKNKIKSLGHDIRGPLGGIVGLSSIIINELDQIQKNDLLEFTQMINKSGNSLIDFLNQILKDIDNLSIGYQTTDLISIRYKLLYMFDATTKQKNIYFEISILSTETVIYLSSTKLLQIMNNLIANAIKYTKEGGTVKVDLEVINSSGRKKLFGKVRDTGIGMSHRKISQILDSQVIESTEGTNQEKGFGYGLEMVKFNLQQLGGQLFIESDENTYTEFSFEIPIPIFGNNIEGNK